MEFLWVEFLMNVHLRAAHILLIMYAHHVTSKAHDIHIYARVVHFNRAHLWIWRSRTSSRHCWTFFSISSMFVVYALRWYCSFATPQYISIKLVSQWYLGKKSQIWPWDVMSSSRAEFCLAKSGCEKMAWKQQQNWAPSTHLKPSHWEFRPAAG